MVSKCLALSERLKSATKDKKIEVVHWNDLYFWQVLGYPPMMTVG